MEIYFRMAGVQDQIDIVPEEGEQAGKLIT
jgi:hypothetical protein